MKNTTLCYIEKDGAYLLMHRTKKKNDENHDKWIGIGGHVEAGESPHECIIREIKEETGLDVAPCDCAYRGIVTFVCEGCEFQYMHLFHTTRFSGDLLKDCNEGELGFLSKDAVKDLPMWEGDAIFLDLLEKDVPFFSLKLVYNGDGVLLSHDLQFSPMQQPKSPLLISACLIGTYCRYDGKTQSLDEKTLQKLTERYTLIPVCPERLGGLDVPRLPAEIDPKTGRVVRKDGMDVTDAYQRGADEVLSYARMTGAKMALLKARSPACGHKRIYDGSFSGTLTDGDGIAAKACLEAGIAVYTEEEVWELIL